MDKKKTKLSSYIRKAWEDTQNWVIGYKFWPYIIGAIFVLVCAMLTTIFTPIDATRLINGFYGLLGGILALAIFVLIIFVVHLILTPSRLVKRVDENISKIIPVILIKFLVAPLKRKYRIVLSTLESMVPVEDEVRIIWWVSID